MCYVFMLGVEIDSFPPFEMIFYNKKASIARLFVRQMLRY